MFEIKLNSGQLREDVTRAMMQIMDSDAVLSQVTTQLVPVMRKRVHEDGQDANGSQIGTYSREYMAVRTGVFKSNGVYKSGPNKGKPKPTGVFTKGPRKGQERPKYNRSGDTKVILSLTRQTENDMKAIPTELGWGIGYSNEDNYNKVIWNEKQYGKKILTELTDQEDDQVGEIAEEYVSNIIDNI